MRNHDAPMLERQIPWHRLELHCRYDSGLLLPKLLTQDRTFFRDIDVEGVWRGDAGARRGALVRFRGAPFLFLSCRIAWGSLGISDRWVHEINVDGTLVFSMQAIHYESGAAPTVDSVEIHRGGGWQHQFLALMSQLRG